MVFVNKVFLSNSPVTAVNVFSLTFNSAKIICLQCLSFSPFCCTISMLTACLDAKCVQSVAQISRKRSIFLPLLQKNPCEGRKETLRLGQINTSSGQSKIDDTFDPLNLLEQKVIRLLSERSCEMTPTAERTRTDHQEQLVEDKQNPLNRKEML